MCKEQFSVSVWMSHWRRWATEGAEFWISCKQPAFLSNFSLLQLIQNSAPPVAQQGSESTEWKTGIYHLNAIWEPPQISKSYAGALFCMSFFIPWYRLCPVFCCLFWFFFYVLKDEGNVHICYIFGLSLKNVFLSPCISPILKLERKSAKKR